MNDLRFAVLGAGFWAKYQLAAWQEVPGAQCVAVCDPTLGKAELLAREFGIANVYDSPEALLSQESLDFIDIVTPVETHAHCVELAASHGVGAICQKPLAPTLADAERMVSLAQDAGIPLFVHENWRWQTPLRRLKTILDAGRIGTPFRARIELISGFPVFINQPFFKELPQFILTDLGSHLLDTTRFLFGEASSLYCRAARVHTDIRGEDVATVMLNMASGLTALCSMAYAENFLEHDRFPETYVFIEGDKGSLELGPDYWIRETTQQGTWAKRYPPPRYAWADPAYDVVQSSIVACHANLLTALRGEGEAETTGADNLETVRLVFAAYDSAARNTVVTF